MRLLWRSVVTSLNEDHNSFLYWYPKIVGRVATPKTVIVLTEGASTKWIDEGAPEPFVLKLKAAAKPLGYPVFMRTEQLSAKHLWEGTCFVQSESVLPKHLYLLIEEQYMALDMQMDATPQAIILREFLHLRSFFATHRHGMPVAREFRCFAANGKIECYHPYWPHGAIEEESPDPNWRDYLPQLEAAPPSMALEMVMKASEAFSEQMSIDICETQDGRWLVTDMATGAESYHWPHGDPEGGARE